MRTSVLVIKWLPLSSKPACEAGAGTLPFSALSSGCYWGSANRGRSREMTGLDKGGGIPPPPPNFRANDPRCCPVFLPVLAVKAASYTDFLCINSVCPHLPFQSSSAFQPISYMTFCLRQLRLFCFVFPTEVTSSFCEILSSSASCSEGVTNYLIFTQKLESEEWWMASISYHLGGIRIPYLWKMSRKTPATYH